jgi:hypothetical protein
LLKLGFFDRGLKLALVAPVGGDRQNAGETLSQKIIV